jgi:MoxR-like ATPase
MGATDIDTRQEHLTALKRNLGQAIQGKDESLDLLTIALLAGGSALIEDVPGVGKTTLAKALTKSIDAKFNRIQFTPDLLPADILGSSIYNPTTGAFDFRHGPIFCNLLLADEINRASPRTQSALLEAMSESHATIDGNPYDLPQPFMVVATQNPIDFHGTYPLPEAQLDRFLLQLDLGYPDPDAEADMLHAQALTRPVDDLTPVLDKQTVLGLQAAVKNVAVARSVSEYIVAIVGKTREHPHLKLGVSPRGSLMLFRAAQAAAFSAGRDAVLPDDVQRMSTHVLPHRLSLTSKAKYDGTQKGALVQELLEGVKVPT